MGVTESLRQLKKKTKTLIKKTITRKKHKIKNIFRVGSTDSNEFVKSCNSSSSSSDDEKNQGGPRVSDIRKRDETIATMAGFATAGSLAISRTFSEEGLQRKKSVDACDRRDSSHKQEVVYPVMCKRDIFVVVNNKGKKSTKSILSSTSSSSSSNSRHKRAQRSWLRNKVESVDSTSAASSSQRRKVLRNNSEVAATKENLPLFEKSRIEGNIAEVIRDLKDKQYSFDNDYDDRNEKKSANYAPTSHAHHQSESSLSQTIKKPTMMVVVNEMKPAEIAMRNASSFETKSSTRSGDGSSSSNHYNSYNSSTLGDTSKDLFLGRRVYCNKEGDESKTVVVESALAPNAKQEEVVPKAVIVESVPSPKASKEDNVPKIVNGEGVRSPKTKVAAIVTSVREKSDPPLSPMPPSFVSKSRAKPGNQETSQSDQKRDFSPLHRHLESSSSHTSAILASMMSSSPFGSGSISSTSRSRRNEDERSRPVDNDNYHQSRKKRAVYTPTSKPRMLSTPSARALQSYCQTGKKPLEDLVEEEDGYLSGSPPSFSLPPDLKGGSSIRCGGGRSSSRTTMQQHQERQPLTPSSSRLNVLPQSSIMASMLYQSISGSFKSKSSYGHACDKAVEMTTFEYDDNRLGGVPFSIKSRERHRRSEGAAESTVSSVTMFSSSYQHDPMRAASGNLLQKLLRSGGAALHQQDIKETIDEEGRFEV